VSVALPAELTDADFTNALDGAHAHAKGQSLSLTVPAMYGTVLLHN